MRSSRYIYMTNTNNPHAGQPVLTRGEPLEQASVAMVMIHGRGGSAQDILTLADELRVPGVAYLAPQAHGNTWYPYSFLAPIKNNEPFLTSALSAVAAVLAQIQAAGISPERTLLLGFSQGACLATEFAAKNSGRYGGVVGLSGGLIGPEGTPRDYAGSLEGTPVFLGCSDIDPHIPLARVHESAEVFRRMGATVDERIYPRMGHTINQDELDAVRGIIKQIGQS